MKREGERIGREKNKFNTKDENEKFIKEVQSLFPFHVALYTQMYTTVLERK